MILRIATESRGSSNVFVSFLHGATIVTDRTPYTTHLGIEIESESTNHPGIMSMNAESTVKRSVSILGAGAWGTTLAILAYEAGNDVTLVSHARKSADFMARYRHHPTSLPGIVIPEPIAIASVQKSDLVFAETVVVALPTQKLRTSLQPLRELLAGRVLLSVVKGLELESILRPTEVMQEVLGVGLQVAALSGPNLAGEVAAGLPATSVIASAEPGLADHIRPMFHTNRFRVYVSDDVVGVELGGALKNIIAIGAGIADGMNAGDNAKAAFMTESPKSHGSASPAALNR